MLFQIVHPPAQECHMLLERGELLLFGRLSPAVSFEPRDGGGEPRQADEAPTPSQQPSEDRYLA